MIKPMSYEAWYEGLGWEEIAKVMLDGISDSACEEFTHWVAKKKPELFAEWASMQRDYNRKMELAYAGAFPEPDDDRDR